jgi:hypothetical protein
LLGKQGYGPRSKPAKDGRIPAEVPSNANLAIYQGDDYSAVVTVSESGSPVPPDLTGFTAQSQIRIGPADANPQVVVEIGTSVAANLVTLTIPAPLTALMSGLYVWDLQLTAPDGTITTILAGGVTVTAQVTKEN